MSEGRHFWLDRKKGEMLWFLILSDCTRGTQRYRPKTPYQNRIKCNDKNENNCCRGFNRTTDRGGGHVHQPVQQWFIIVEDPKTQNLQLLTLKRCYLRGDVTLGKIFLQGMPGCVGDKQPLDDVMIPTKVSTMWSTAGLKYSRIATCECGTDSFAFSSVVRNTGVLCDVIIYLRGRFFCTFIQ